MLAVEMRTASDLVQLPADPRAKSAARFARPEPASTILSSTTSRAARAPGRSATQAVVPADFTERDWRSPSELPDNRAGKRVLRRQSQHRHLRSRRRRVRSDLPDQSPAHRLPNSSANARLTFVHWIATEARLGRRERQDQRQRGCLAARERGGLHLQRLQRDAAAGARQHQSARGPAGLHRHRRRGRRRLLGTLDHQPDAVRAGQGQGPHSVRSSETTAAPASSAGSSTISSTTVASKLTTFDSRGAPEGAPLSFRRLPIQLNGSIRVYGLERIPSRFLVTSLVPK